METKISGIKSSGSGHASTRVSPLYVIAFVLIAGFIILLMLNYDATWMHPEYPAWYIPWALKNGVALVPGDYVPFFDMIVWESRARLIANVLLLFDVKFRVWLFQYVPSHPSLSLMWIFTLILSPVLLFKLIYNMTRSRTAGWIGISLYCISPGFLCNVTLLHFPAKPLCNFFAIFCLYLASKICRGAQECCAPRRNTVFLYIIFLFVMLLSFFTDEAAFFLLIAVPLLFPDVLKVTRKWTLNIALYVSPVIFFLLFVVFVIPFIGNLLGFEQLNCLGFAARGRNFWERFGTGNIIYNGSKWSLCHIFPSRVLFGHQPPFGFHLPPSPRSYMPYILTADGVTYPRGSIIYGIAFSLCVICLITQMQLSKRKLFFRSCALLLLFIVFQSALLTRHNSIIQSSYYYGALFSLFLAISLAILLSSFEKGFLNILSKALFICIIGSSGFNFIFINRDAMDEHEISYRNAILGPSKIEMKKGAQLTFPMVLRAWRSRNDPAALMKMRSAFPIKSYWLFQELEYTRMARENVVLSESAVITASSERLPGGEVHHLLDDDGRTNWHVAPEKVGEQSWVTVDLGEGGNRVVSSLEARANRDHPEQFFRDAFLLGSMDGKNWEEIAPIIFHEVPLHDELHLWRFENTKPFRYYKLLINDCHGDKASHRFYSMAELAMYE